LPPRRLGPGAIVAIVAHILVIVAVLWERSSYLQSTLGDRGPRGGGGTGEAARFVALPPAAAQAAVSTPPLVAPVAAAQPIVEPFEIPRIAINPQPVTIVGPVVGSSGAGSPGSGGGAGGGTGPGVGTSVGPGTGGDGGYIVPPEVVGLIVPPDCARGQFAVRFSIDVQGRVARVDVEPPPKDAGCRREFLSRMREYKFKPARTVEGRPVAGVTKIDIIR